MLAVWVLWLLRLVPSLLLLGFLGLFAINAARIDPTVVLVLGFCVLAMLGSVVPLAQHVWHLGQTLFTFRHGAISLDDEAVYSGGRKALLRSEIERVEWLAFDAQAEVTLRVRRAGRKPYALVLRAPRGVVRDFAEALGADLLQPIGVVIPAAFSRPVMGGWRARLLRVRHAYGGLFVPLWIAGFVSAGMLGSPVLAVLMAFAGVALLAAMLAVSLRLGRVGVTTEGVALVGNAELAHRGHRGPIPWERVVAVERAPNVLTLTLRGEGAEATETIVLRPTQPAMRWRLAAALQTHLAASRARRRGTGIVEALAQAGRSVEQWCTALERLTHETHGYREGPGVSPEALWLVATDETADPTDRVAALVALAGGQHIAPEALLWSLARRDPAVGDVVPESLATQPFARAVALSTLAAVAVPVRDAGGVRIAPEGQGEALEVAENEGIAATGRRRGAGGE